MPNDLYSLDASFPQFTGRESEKQRVGAIYDYLIQLQQTLRYCLQNLGSDNFNDTELEIIGNTIREPVYLRLTGVEKETVYIAMEASKLTSRMETAEGNISEFEQSAQELSARVAAAEGYITELIADADGLFARVGNAEGEVTKLTQKVDSFTLSVSNGKDSSTIKLMAGDAVISSQNIKFEGVVTFTTDETDGKSVIEGGRIRAEDVESDEASFGWIMVSGRNETRFVEVTPTDVRFRNDDLDPTWVGQIGLDRENKFYIGSTLGSAKINFSDTDIYLTGNVYVNGKLIS